ncbi:MAG TPA: hypothetical protein VM266_11195 [Solirubrobacteraceae bacterium]|nr:hypothetical protein [Solirubrobacteraceae bacterium]
MISAAIEFDLLLEVIVVSLVAGVGVTALFSLVIYGSSQAGEARRAGRGGAATAFGLLAAVAMSGFALTIVLALMQILNKE